MAKKRSKAASSSVKDIGPATRMLILHGKEHYLIVETLRKLRDIMEAAHGDVDQIHFDGSTCSVADVLDEARSFGLMQQYKIVVVDNAEDLTRAENNRRMLERYAAAPAEQATLVLRAQTWRAPKLDKAAAKVGQVIKCEAPDAARAVKFCQDRCIKRYGCEVEYEAAVMLVQRIGSQLAKLDSELGRLSLMVDRDAPITTDLVATEIGLSREESAWQVQEALLSGNAQVALAEVRELLEISRQPPVLMNYALCDLARKMYSAASLRSAGVPDHAIASQLKLWGNAKNAILQAAQQVDPVTLARLLHDLVDGDVRMKSGFGEAERTIELGAVRFLAATSSRNR